MSLRRPLPIRRTVMFLADNESVRVVGYGGRPGLVPTGVSCLSGRLAWNLAVNRWRDQLPGSA
jgi:hypothetical protein